MADGEVAPVRVMVTFISSANKRSRCATPASPAAAGINIGPTEQHAFRAEGQQTYNVHAGAHPGIGKHCQIVADRIHHPGSARAVGMAPSSCLPP